MNPKDIQRFFSKVQKTDNCWNWIAPTDEDGYGYFKMKGKQLRSHRVSYELFKELIPTGLTIDHLCRNRKCVNPDHLEVVTVKENVLRGIGITAKNKLKTHCPEGHPYNKKRNSQGRRICKICHALTNRISFNKMKGVKNYSN